YSIFSLVSEHYRHIGAFGKYLNNIFQELGASIIYPIELGNVHFGLESSFYKWADGVYK
ncbi:nitric oxide synthase, partial [Biomphalaria glabrata]